MHLSTSQLPRTGDVDGLMSLYEPAAHFVPAVTFDAYEARGVMTARST
jgi:hypothetical protein